MIEIQTKIHDNFSVEFKVGFLVSGDAVENNFMINSWIFVPNSLDINPLTYDKNLFYRDVKSNIRLVTPTYILRNIADDNSEPINFLSKALHDLSVKQSRKHISEYKYQIKMFSAIVKSSLRNEVNHILNTKNPNDIIFLANEYLNNTKNIAEKYRAQKRTIDIPTIDQHLRDHFLFGDEFISYMVENNNFKLLKFLINFEDIRFDDTINLLKNRIYEESTYMKSMNYDIVEHDNPTNNRNLIYRHSLLKKYIESELYIKLNKKTDGVTVKQIYYSLAAGIAMIFATIVAFSFQLKFGSFSIPVFVALVVSYMLKDRIKDLVRYYFAHKLGTKYFDNKAIINIKDNPVGWVKEAVDFIEDSNVPTNILKIRNRSSLLKSESQIFDEKIMLYRKHVSINCEKLSLNNKYNTRGVVDILRLHINRFTQKMDNPQVPLNKLDKDGNIEHIETSKIYYLNVVMHFVHGTKNEYKRFRIVASRSGIIEVQEINNG